MIVHIKPIVNAHTVFVKDERSWVLIIMKEILAQRLRDCRAKLNYSQMQAATYSDITERAYANYELARQMPKLDIIMRIADVYNVSIDYLVGRTDDPNVNRSNI